jgi:hypothetical protein
MEEEDYLNQYAQRLQDSLVRLCTTREMMGGVLLENDDIESKFTEELARPYLTDAIREYREYPEAAVAWAGYLGMAVAKLWDADWQAYQQVAYTDLLGPRGFDDMDERILTQVLGYELDSEPAGRICDILSKCAAEALAMIRHEHIEPASPRAYYVFARTVQVLYRIGASIELFLLGYKLEKLNM